LKFPPRKCRICAFVGLWGVGASGSTAATTNVSKMCAKEGDWTAKVGGIAVSRERRMRLVAVQNENIIGLGSCYVRLRFRCMPAFRCTGGEADSEKVTSKREVGLNVKCSSEGIYEA